MQDEELKSITSENKNKTIYLELKSSLWNPSYVMKYIKIWKLH